jgi:uncharacterized cupin superfamily protein
MRPAHRRHGRYVPRVQEATLESTETGIVQAGPGWFVVNAHDARWLTAEGRGSVCPFGDEDDFRMLGVNLFVLAPGEAMGIYHWEADQENFLILQGTPLLIVEGEERPLRQWDFVHCPPGTKHVILGAGETESVVIAVGARGHRGQPGWGGYPVDETALRHGVGVEQETTDAAEAYALLPRREARRYGTEAPPDEPAAVEADEREPQGESDSAEPLEQAPLEGTEDGASQPPGPHLVDGEATEASARAPIDSVDTDRPEEDGELADDGELEDAEPLESVPIAERLLALAAELKDQLDESRRHLDALTTTLEQRRGDRRRRRWWGR